MKIIGNKWYWTHHYYLNLLFPIISPEKLGNDWTWACWLRWSGSAAQTQRPGSESHRRLTLTAANCSHCSLLSTVTASGFLPNSDIGAWSCDIIISWCHTCYRRSFLELWYWSCCDTRVFRISDILILGTMISKYPLYQMYCDVRAYPISEFVISGYTDITVPLISEFVISGYTDITALRCDIRVILISGFQMLYPIIKGRYHDHSFKTLISGHILMSLIMISEFFRYQSSWCHTLCFSHRLILAFQMLPSVQYQWEVHNAVHQTLFNHLALPVHWQPCRCSNPHCLQ